MHSDIPSSIGIDARERITVIVKIRAQWARLSLISFFSGKQESGAADYVRYESDAGSNYMSDTE
jgi:hypothetical protein